MQTHEDQPPEEPTRESAPNAPRQPEDSAGEHGLSRVEGPHDTPPAPTSHRKRSRASAEPPAPPEDDRLALPRGGLVALRVSGGFRFGSREIVVYRSGKMAYRRLAPSGAAPAAQARQLPLSQLVELHHLLKESGLARLPATAGRQSSDALAYEIVARVGRVVRAAEVFAGGIPETLAPLIRELQQLMPEDEAGGAQASNDLRTEE
jgi:hypothetical protein